MHPTKMVLCVFKHDYTVKEVLVNKQLAALTLGIARLASKSERIKFTSDARWSWFLNAVRISDAIMGTIQTVQTWQFSMTVI